MENQKNFTIQRMQITIVMSTISSEHHQHYEQSAANTTRAPNNNLIINEFSTAHTHTHNALKRFNNNHNDNKRVFLVILFTALYSFSRLIYIISDINHFCFLFFLLFLFTILVVHSSWNCAYNDKHKVFAIN